MMERILSKSMPHYMVRKSRTSHFDNSGRLKWDWNAPEARYTNQHCKPLNQYGRRNNMNLSNKNHKYHQHGSHQLTSQLKSHPMFQSTDHLSRMVDNSCNSFSGSNTGSQMFLNNTGSSAGAGIGPQSDDPQEIELMYDLIARMLEYDPNSRMNLRDSLKHEFFDKLLYTHSRLYNGLESDLSRHVLRLQI